MLKRKPCISCQRVLPLAAFYPHPQMRDGHLNKCKECQKAAVRAVRAANPEYYRAYDRQRGDLPHRLAAVAAYQKTKRGREQLNAKSKEWVKRHPEKRKAHVWVGNAIRDGRLIRSPCEMCGAEKVTAHHDDYTKPMEVRWFCGPCHRAHHKAERETMRHAC